MGNRFLNHKGQAILEAAIVTVLLIVLLGGILNIWLWANNQVVLRQARYNASRVSSGKATDDYSLQWPVYQPQELSEDKVLLN